MVGQGWDGQHKKQWQTYAGHSLEGVILAQEIESVYHGVINERSSGVTDWKESKCFSLFVPNFPLVSQTWTFRIAW